MFSFHLDLTGIIWGALSMLSLIVGGLFALTSGIIALSNANNKYRVRAFQRALSFFYGSLIPVGFGAMGALTIGMTRLPRGQREFLDMAALPMAVGALLGMIFLTISRNRRVDERISAENKA